MRASCPNTYSMRDERRLADLADLERVDDVLVLELRQHARLVQEHRDVLLVVGQVRQDALDRDDRLPGRVMSRAFRISAMPPMLMRSSSSYLPKGMGRLLHSRAADSRRAGPVLGARVLPRTAGRNAARTAMDRVQFRTRGPGDL